MFSPDHVMSQAYSIVDKKQAEAFIEKRKKKIKDTNILSREAPESGNTVVLFYLFSDQVLIKMMGYR